MPRIQPIYYGVTDVDTVMRLLAMTLSAGAELTVKRWVSQLSLVLTMLVTVALAPAANCGRQHTLTAAMLQCPPSLGVTLFTLPPEMILINVTDMALSGPLLVIVNTYWAFSPLFTEAG